MRVPGCRIFEPNAEYGVRKLWPVKIASDAHGKVWIVVKVESSKRRFDANIAFLTSQTISTIKTN